MGRGGRPFLRAAVLGLLPAVLLSCGGESVTYWPHEFGTEWKYDIFLENRYPNGKVFSFNREEVRRIIGPLPGEEVRAVTLMVEEGNWQATVVFHRDEEGFFRVFPPPVSDKVGSFEGRKGYVIKEPLQPGLSWEVCHDSYYRGGFCYPLTATVSGMGETVTVPAGTYEGCVRVQYGGGYDHLREDKAPWGKITVLRDVRSPTGVAWFAPEVGLVKSELTEEVVFTQDGRERSRKEIFLRYELASFISPEDQ